MLKSNGYLPVGQKNSPLASIYADESVHSRQVFALLQDLHRVKHGKHPFESVKSYV